jgi:F-type H+-transporting ATPase subunit delta
MVNVSVARRYARALLDVAAEAKAVDRVADQLTALAGAIEGSDELRDVLQNPAYTRTTRRAVLESVAKSAHASDPALHNLLMLLIDRDRTRYLADIARIFRTLADARAGRVRGQVTSAVALSKDALAHLSKALEKVTQRNVVLEARVDPGLIGGVSAQVGSVLYDGSIRTQLEEMRRQLKRA